MDRYDVEQAIEGLRKGNRSWLLLAFVLKAMHKRLIALEARQENDGK